MELTTEARVSQLINPGGALTPDSNDAAADQTVIFRQLIIAVSSAAEGYMDRQAKLKATTEYLTVRDFQRLFQLKAWPVESVTSVAFDPEQTFGTDTLLVAVDDYLNPVLSESGILAIRRDLWSADEPARESLRVIYRGGMAATTEEFIKLYPDLAGAIDQQIAYIWARRNQQGVQSIGGELGNVAFPSPPVYEWCFASKTVLDRYRRITFAA